MTSRVLVGIRIALVLSATAPAMSCGGSTHYVLQVDSPVKPFKAADPDDLIVDDGSGDDDDEDEAKPEKGSKLEE